MALSLKAATLHELQTVYSVEDLHDMIEVALIDSENAYRSRPRPRREQ
jgi:hypothetical protein